MVRAPSRVGLSSAVNVAFFAHLGGFVAGVAVIAAARALTGRPVLPRRPQPWGYWRDDAPDDR